MDFKSIISTTEYDFLRTNPRLVDRIILLGVSGSYGYGTNREGSDIDFRGVTLNMPSDLLGLTQFEQYEDILTDTVGAFFLGFTLPIHTLITAGVMVQGCEYHPAAGQVHPWKMPSVYLTR